MKRDPVCGMDVDERSAVRVVKDGDEYFFCSVHCKDKFLKQEGAQDVIVCLPQSRNPFFKNKLFLVSAVSVLCVAGAGVFPFLGAFRREFLSYIRMIWWAVAVGLFLGGVIDYYVPREYISKILAKKKAGTIIKAVSLGFLLSACSHGILALTIQLHKKGASNPAVVAFLLASPWANFTITVMLIGFFGFKGLFIIIAALIVAVNTGLIFMFLEERGLIEKNSNSLELREGFSILHDIKARCKRYHFGRKTLLADSRGVLRGTVSLADMVLWWIIIGIFISSLAGAYIPVHFFHKYMGPTLLGLFVTLALATVIEVCSEGSSPLAFEIYRQTGALGNSFTFLMAGVATDYTEIGLLWTNVGRRVALWLPVVSVPQIILLGLLFNRIFK